MKYLLLLFLLIAAALPAQTQTVPITDRVTLSSSDTPTSISLSGLGRSVVTLTTKSGTNGGVYFTIFSSTTPNGGLEASDHDELTTITAVTYAAGTRERVAKFGISSKALLAEGMYVELYSVGGSTVTGRGVLRGAQGITGFTSAFPSSSTCVIVLAEPLSAPAAAGDQLRFVTPAPSGGLGTHINAGESATFTVPSWAGTSGTLNVVRETAGSGTPTIQLLNVIPSN